MYRVSTVFIFPTLPVALYGLLFLIGSRLRLRRRYIILLGISVLAAVLIALTLVMRFASSSDRGLWIPSMILYLYMTLSLAALQHPLLIVCQIVLVTGARIVGIAAGAMSDRAYFPYCELKNDVFGGFYLAVGLLGGLLAFCAKYKWNPFPWSYPGVGKPILSDAQRAGYRRIGRKLAVRTDSQG